MKKRVIINLTFDDEAKADKLYTIAKACFDGEVSKHSVNDQIVEIHDCKHDEGLPCENAERWELSSTKRDNHVV